MSLTQAQIADQAAQLQTARMQFNNGAAGFNANATALNGLWAKSYPFDLNPLIAAINAAFTSINAAGTLLKSTIDATSVLVPSDPTPPPPPPPPPVTNPAGLNTLYDGADGVSADYWNAGLGLSWTVRGGDHTDAAGTVQGAVPFATLLPDNQTSSRNFNGDATALVKYLITHGNPGIKLILKGSAWLANRYSDPQYVPRLTIDGKSVVCTASNAMNTSSTSTTPVDTVGKTMAPPLAAIQFDLSAITSCTSATFAVTGWAASDTQKIEVYALKIPSFIADFPLPAAVDISKRTDLLVDSDWKPDMSAVLPEGQMAWDTLFAADPVAGGIATFRFGPGQYEPVALMRRHSTLKIPQLREAYVGFWMRLEDDGTTLQGQKIGMGISGRGGAAGVLQNGGLAPVCGNGGSPCTGKYVPASPSNPNNGAAYTCGWSMRPLLLPRAGDGNTLINYRGLAVYAYWARMPLIYSGFGSPIPLKALIQKGVWYWIVQRIKLNTVGGTIDANGNGVGNNDGEYQTWINGFDVSPSGPDQGKWCLTDNPNIALDELPWVDFYEGGAKDPTTVSRVSMGRFVVAKSMIPVPAPRGAPVVVPDPTPKVPAWLAGKAKNTVIEIPNTALDNADNSRAIAAGYAGPGYGRLGAMMDYSGGCMVDTMLTLWGGGSAGSWQGNQFMGLELTDNAPAFRCIIDPSPTTVLQATGNSPMNLDGSRANGHSYYQLHYCKQTGEIILYKARNLRPADSGSYGHTYHFKIGQVQPKAAAFISTHLSNADGAWACMDSATGRIYTGTAWSVICYDPITKSESVFWTKEGANNVDCGGADIGLGKLMRLGLYGGDPTITLVAMLWDLSTGQLTQGPLSGPADVLAELANDGTAFKLGSPVTFDPGLGLWAPYHHGLNKLYTVDAKLNAARLPYTGTIPVGRGTGDGPKGRVRYVAIGGVGGIVIARSPDVNVAFIRTI